MADGVRRDKKPPKADPCDPVCHPVPPMTAHAHLIAYSELAPGVSAEHSGYEGRSHSLWYCDA
jgi:hypothetical protein